MVTRLRLDTANYPLGISSEPRFRKFTNREAVGEALASVEQASSQRP